jgi:hypothetical protein
VIKAEKLNAMTSCSSFLLIGSLIQMTVRVGVRFGVTVSVGVSVGVSARVSVGVRERKRRKVDIFKKMRFYQID